MYNEPIGRLVYDVKQFRSLGCHPQFRFLARSTNDNILGGGGRGDIKSKF